MFYDLKITIKITLKHPHSFASSTQVVFDRTGSLPLRIMLSKLKTIYIQRSCKSVFIYLFY